MLFVAGQWEGRPHSLKTMVKWGLRRDVGGVLSKDPDALEGTKQLETDSNAGVKGRDHFWSQRHERFTKMKRG